MPSLNIRGDDRSVCHPALDAESPLFVIPHLMRDPYPLRLPDGLDDEAHLERGVALGTGGDAGSVEAGLEAGLEGDPAVELAYGGFLGGVGAVERGELALAVAADFEYWFHYG